MNPNTAELANAEGISDLAAPAPPPVAPAAAWLARLRSDSARMAAARESWRALWSSRALVWIAGVGTVLALGYGPQRKAFDPPGVTRGFGWLGDLLAAPAARWDAAWYLVIARYGYRPDLGSYTEPRAAFFPVYPLGVRAVSWLGAPPLVAGVALSTAALAAALYGIHRLTTLELAGGGRAPRGARGAGEARRAGEARAAETARLAVMLTAFAPMAFFLSAVYSESLYLALSVGVFWSARHGRWRWVGVLGALAAATRSAGLVLALPALAIYLYGPREDRAPDRAADAGERPEAAEGRARAPAARAAARVRAALRGLRPRYSIRSDLAWLALLPAGVIAYCAYLGLAGGEPLAPFKAQEDWSRHFAGPFVGVWDGLRAAFEGARQLLSFQRAHVYFPSGGGDPTIAASHNLMLFAFLALAVPAIVGTLRRLPLAYGGYVLAALALPLSYPVASQPLMSLPRFLLVLFPLSMWLAAWLAERPRLRRPALLACGASMAFFLAQFATWHWVA
ncbi:MAG TPA: mannosyltransferase family protein [Solirubrobacteraceae bacterium]|nr:mannosyltransferase family protein [Solirubrobacteraceae bacterium]